LDHAKDLSTDSLIYGDAAERYAARFAVVEPAADTGIPQHIVPVAGISYRQLTSTSPASQETCQQRLAVPGGARLGLSLVVLLNDTLDLFKLFPADVAFMGAWNQKPTTVLSVYVGR
jgi:hypothetical protein